MPTTSSGSRPSPTAFKWPNLVLPRGGSNSRTEAGNTQTLNQEEEQPVQLVIPAGRFYRHGDSKTREHSRGQDRRGHQRLTYADSAFSRSGSVVPDPSNAAYQFYGNGTLQALESQSYTEISNAADALSTISDSLPSKVLWSGTRARPNNDSTSEHDDVWRITKKVVIGGVISGQHTGIEDPSPREDSKAFSRIMGDAWYSVALSQGEGQTRAGVAPAPLPNEARRGSQISTCVRHTY